MKKVKYMFETIFNNLKDFWVESFTVLGKLLPTAIVASFFHKGYTSIWHRCQRIGMSVVMGMVAMFLCEYYLDQSNRAVEGAICGIMGAFGADLFDFLRDTIMTAKEKLPSKIVDRCGKKIDDVE